MNFFPFIPGVAVSAALIPFLAFAAPETRSVLLYDNGARITETHSVPRSDKIFRLVLPESAVRDSVTISSDTAYITGLEFKTVPNSAALSPDGLQVQIENLQEQITAKQAHKESLSIRYQYWKAFRPKLESVQDTVTFDESMGEKLETLAADLHVTEKELNELDEQLALLVTQAEEAGISEKALLVTAGLQENETPADSFRINVSYDLESCGWSHSTRIEARPNDKKVIITRIASVRQNTGMDWDDVELTLQGAAPDTRLRPAALKPWNIVPYSPPVEHRAAMAGAKNSANLDMAEEAVPMMMAAQKVQKPKYSDNSVSGTWDLGKRTLKAGSDPVITLSSESCDAEFYRLIRPSQSPVSFIAAHVENNAAFNLPKGDKQILLDGMPIGNDSTAIAGKSVDFFFGTDPGVTAVMKENKGVSGKQGIISKKRTYEWGWTIEAKNAHSYPVKVKIEDPMPKAGDKEILVMMTSAPKPYEDNGTLRWELELKGAEVSQITHAVAMEAPADLNVRTGR